MAKAEKIEGKEVKAALQGLDGRQGNPGEPLDRQELRAARMPDQAAPAGEKPARANFIRGDVRQLSRAERERRMGAEKAGLANRVEDRYISAEKARRGNAPTPNVRGRLVADNPNFGIGRNEFELTQGATSAAVNPAPQPSRAMVSDPWQVQGPSPRVELAGGSGSPPPRNPVAALPYGFDNDGLRQGPRRGDNYMFSPEGVGITSPRRANQETNYRQAVRNYGRVRKVGRNAAIAGGAVAGLDLLIGDERDRREEEVQYQ